MKKIYILIWKVIIFFLKNMSFIKKSPYDKFKISSKKLIIHTPKTLLRPFSSSQTTQSLLLNKILKGTKLMLKNKNKFSGYMKEYQSIVEKSTFKRPDIQNYPLLRRENSSMIPIKNQKIEKPKKNKIIKYILNNQKNLFSFREKFIHNLIMSMSMSSLENRNMKYKYSPNKNIKENLLLFSDFYYKWNNNNNESIGKYNNKYSTLNYDENEIFYNDYTDLIKEKKDNLLTHKIENLQKKLKINFTDSQKKKIKLQLISMKLIFEPLNDDEIKSYKKDYNFEDYKEINDYKNEDSEEENDNENDNDIDNNINNKNIITLPLSYVFLFYINGIDYFKNILLSSITFSNDYQKVFFEENEIYTAIRNKRIKRNVTMPRKTNNRFFGRKESIKQLTKEILLKKNNSYLKMKSSIDKEKEKDKSVNFEKNENTDENYKNDIYGTDKKIVTIHADPDLRKKENSKNDYFKKNNEIKYTEYCFIWETPNKTYRVRIIMPIIIFWSEHIHRNIVTYCDKDLFLFLLKNNFVNWDYYILNYLFSIKAFRQIILSSLSFYSNRSLYNAKLSSLSEIKKRNKAIYPMYKIDNSLFSFINEKSIILNTNKKIYNHLNENNESYEFFYTNNTNVNSIIEFHSYHIFIECDKLNSKKCWEFALNFKQMNYLSNISKYEDLENFLPKIIHTNFEDGNISMDFSVFEYFNTKILEHKENKENENSKMNNSFSNLNINNENYNKKKINKDMLIFIKMPFIIYEQYVKSNYLSNKIQKFYLNSKFLNVLNNLDNIYWSKKILNLINYKNSKYEQNNLSLDLVRGKNCFSFNDSSKIDLYDYDEYISDYHKIKTTSKSFHYKKKKTNLSNY